MNKFLLCIFFFLFCFNIEGNSNESTPYKQDVREIFNIGKMLSHDKEFTLFFKTRDKAILARGEDYNYVTDFPQDLYIYNYKTKISSPLISYEWFPSQAKHLLEGYDYPVFPEDFAYYLLKDNNTLVMISAIKNIRKNFKFDIANKKLNSYPSNGKFDFIISSIAKNCGHSDLKENYKCSYYKPLISNNLIN